MRWVTRNIRLRKQQTVVSAINPQFDLHSEDDLEQLRNRPHRYNDRRGEGSDVLKNAAAAAAGDVCLGVIDRAHARMRARRTESTLVYFEEVVLQ